MAPILTPGENCWRRAAASRVGFLVDAAAYFDAVAAAVERARHSVRILGWDIHSRTRLRPASDEPERWELAQVLDRATARRPALEVHTLVWDPAVIYVGERELLSSVRFAWRTGPRVNFALASDHPAGASHHQKVVVVDGQVAFVGGIDLTAARWDDREHRPKNPLRELPNGERYGPFHDVAMVFDGEAAAALDELVRVRWENATNEPLSCGIADNGDPWPQSVEPDLRDVHIGLSRTAARWRDRPGIREVEQLFLDSVAAARRHIYIENQYVTSEAVCEALCGRLRASDGPELLLVTPREQSGPLEKAVMGTLRTRVVRRLRAADEHGRLRIVAPTVGGDDAVGVNVHAKVMIIDDRLVRVGSANLSNRSMALDTECDASIESEGDDASARAITCFRDGLIAEHLGVPTAQVSELVRERGSLLAAVDDIAPRGGRRLVEPELDERAPEFLDAAVLDPHEPLDEALLRQAIPDTPSPSRRWLVLRLALTLAAVLALALLWTQTSLGEWLRPSRLAEVAPFQDSLWGVVVGIAALATLVVLMVPVTPLIVTAVLVYGPWHGFLVALFGSVLGGAAGFALGHVLWRKTLQRLAGRWLSRLDGALRKRGLLTATMVRIVPVAPFSVVNLVAGSSGLSFRDFVLGTLLGMLPGTIALAFASDRIVEALRHPSLPTVAVALGVVAVFVVFILGLQRLLRRMERRRKAEERTTKR